MFIGSLIFTHHPNRAGGRKPNNVYNRSIISQRLDDIARPILGDPRNHRARQSISSGRGAGSSGYRNPPPLPRQTARSNSIRSNGNRSNRSHSQRGSSTNLHRSGHRGSGSGRGSINSARSGSRYRGNTVTRTTTTTTTTANIVEYGVNCVNNKVQKQIERMFTDVAKDQATCSFAVRCLGSMPLKSKVTSLFELQEPLRQLYLSGFGHNVSRAMASFWVFWVFWTEVITVSCKRVRMMCERRSNRVKSTQKRDFSAQQIKVVLSMARMIFIDDISFSIE